ncbi:MAG TPA: thiamine-phosphate kinase [Thermoanaerobaculia bacterium]|jgi:thiamine-monophosphate kinase|nr:thiamine-phosphate kinase [Thermoanaerobaculia bacterium]
MSANGEDRLLRWLRARLASPLIGDDAALLPPLGPVAVTVDSQIAGVHFPPDLAAADLARRLLAVNLSDLAAMGATPAYGFLALSAAPGFDHKKFFLSFLAACRRHGLTLAGGDLARHPGGTIATLTLIGTKAEDARWLQRSGAEPGQALWLGGTVGEAAAGRLLIERGARLAGSRIDLPAFCEAFSSPLRTAARRAVRRHLQPQPQLALGRWLGAEVATRTTMAAMDVSDGVARDLHRLCHESGVGAEIAAEALPFTTRFTTLCAALGAEPLALALTGGEDYVLLFTLPPELAPPPELGGRRIGTITRRGLFLVRDGARQELPDAGWDHLADDSDGEK